MFLRRSAWNYETGATGGAGIGYVVGSGGKIILTDPAGVQQTFYYGGLGAGLSAGFKIPKVKLPALTYKGKGISGAGSATAFPSGGYVFMAPFFKGSELTYSDIQGATVYIDAGAGVIGGVSGSAMILGIEPLPLIAGLSNPAMFFLAEEAIRRAPAILLMAGVNVGPQFGGGVGALAGYLR